MTRKERNRLYYAAHKKKTTKHCAMCGGELEHGNQTYCLDCLLRDFAHAYKTGEGYYTATHRLYSRGYDTKEMLAEVQKRGYI